METVEKFLGSCMSTTASSYGSSCKADGVITDQFPAGLRVLVVDDDTTCLRILEQMLKRCYYKVTTCSQATQALSLLRERKGCFDVIISDVHMPDMDGFKLLELIGLEMALPVIMMSADGRTSAVMRGIKHGACDYLIKPVRFEELKNIWQHVIRKKWNGNKEPEQSSSEEDNHRHKRGSDDVDYASSANEGTDGSWKSQKKWKEAKEEDGEGELENDDPSTSKKPRVVWSVELHQQFVTAVNQLGIDKAVPKRILELMNVPGLTRENVASHLQKFRLYLKRLSGVPQQQGGLPDAFYGPGESHTKGSLGRIDIQALATSGQIPAQTLAALHAEVLGRPTGSLVLPTMDKSVLLQASLQGSKCIPVEHGVTFGQPIVKGQSNISKQFSQPNASVENLSSEFGTWSSNSLGTVGSAGNLVGLNNQNRNMLMQIFQQQRQQQHHQSVLPESIHTINVRPSCLVFPSLSPNNFHTGNSSVPLNQNPNFGSNGVIDYSLLSSQSHNASVGLGQVTDIDIQSSGVLNGYPVPASISPSVSSCSVHADSGMSWQVQNATVNLSASSKLPGFVPYMCDVQGSYSSKLPDQGPDSNLGFVGKGASIPSRIAVEDIELQNLNHVEDIELQNLNHGKPFRKNDDGVKQEISLDFTANGIVGMPAIQQFSPGDLMSIYSK